MGLISYTNSSLAAARRCLTEYDLRYLQRLEQDTDEEREALEVGTCWHRAHDAAAKPGGMPYQEIDEHAPSLEWAEKLKRLFAAYAWFWKSQPFEILEAESKFRVVRRGDIYEGRTDGLIRKEGRKGILERKTSGEAIDAEANYWNRLRMDVQVGIYAISLPELPSFILYDVVRKPTINPKNLAKKDLERMRAEILKSGSATYYGETFTEAQLAPAIEAERESIALYGARLTADIGDRPEYYFARREVPRTEQDYLMLKVNLSQQVDLIEHAHGAMLMHRNPDSCAKFGLCTYFGLCSNNVRPQAGDLPPDGFRRREHLHPELAD